MSDSNSVKVTIAADAAAFRGPVGDSAVSAQAFAAALDKVGGNLSKITPAMLGMATATKTAATATTQAAAATKSAAINFQEIINATTGADRAFKSAADSASVFERALDPTPLQKMKSLLGEIPAAAEHAHTGMAGITRELFVMGHEAMMGRYSFIPGSMMVLAERTNFTARAVEALKNSFTLMGGLAVGALLAVAGALITVIMRAHEANVAVREAMNAATMQGRDPLVAAENVKKYSEELKNSGIVGTAAANQIGSAIDQLSNATNKQKEEINAIGPALFLGWKRSAETTVDNIKGIFASDTSMKTWLDANHILTVDQQTAWAKADSAAKRYQLGLDALSDRYGKITAQAKQMKADADMNLSMAALAGMEGGGAGMPMVGAGKITGPEDLGDFEPGTKNPDKGAEENRAATQAANSDLAEKLRLDQELIKVQGDLDAAQKSGNKDAIADAQHAKANISELIANWKAAGDASVQQKWSAALLDIRNGLAATAKSSKSLNEEMDRATVDFYANVLKQTDLSVSQRRAAEAAYGNARLALQKEELSAGESAAAKALREKLAALTEEQAANHDNYAKVIALENEKLAALKAAGSLYTAQYSSELAKRDAMEREHATKMVEQAMQDLAEQRTLDTQELAQRRDALEAEVAEGKISNQTKLEDLRAFATEKHAIELQSLETLRGTLDQETDAYKKMTREIATLQAQWATQSAQLSREQTQDQVKRWQEMSAPVSSAIEGQVSEMVRGTQTIGQSMARMAGNIIISYTQMAAKAALTWAGQKAMALIFATQEQTGKTAAALAGSATRRGIETAETATGNASLIVRLGRWIATQLGMTSATAAGAASRETVLSTEQVTAVTATGLAARLNVAAAAAVAAAWAFADSAQLGPPGLAAAPAAAAGAYASTMAYQASIPSLAVGAWNVPKDMGANLHAGEMVVPASFAAGMRSAGGGGSASGQTLNYKPTVNGGGGSADLSSAMRAQAAQFKTFLWHATRNGALTTPGGAR